MEHHMGCKLPQLHHRHRHRYRQHNGCCSVRLKQITRHQQHHSQPVAGFSSVDFERFRSRRGSLHSLYYDLINSPHRRLPAISEEISEYISADECNGFRGRRKRRREIISLNNNAPLPQLKRAIYIFVYTLFAYMIFASTSITPTKSSLSNYATSSALTSAHNNRDSGHFLVSQLCGQRSQFPVSRRVEGAVLRTRQDDNNDVNCTITFRTKSTQQHFVIRFEELKLGCDDHLVLFDGDLDYGQPSIKDFSCRDSMASVPIIKTTGTFLTIRYSSDSSGNVGEGFSMVVTAVFDISLSDCPAAYAYCRNHLCISRSLFCDDVNHCLDNSDESGCREENNASSDLPYALGFLVILILVISICVIIFIGAIYCRRENSYAQYQHHVQRTFGIPLQTSSSLMFGASQQPQYHFFQPANMSPYVTPQHHALTTLPRGYSTLPLNMARHQPNHHHPQTILAKANNNGNTNDGTNAEYLMMSGLAAPQTMTHVQAGPAMHTNLFLPTSQSILPTTAIRYSQASSQDRG